MIEVTRLDGTVIYLNPHQVETLELRPDTTITLHSGRQLIVRENYELILEKIVEYRKKIAPWGNEE